MKCNSRYHRQQKTFIRSNTELIVNQTIKGLMLSAEFVTKLYSFVDTLRLWVDQPNNFTAFTFDILTPHCCDDLAVKLEGVIPPPRVLSSRRGRQKTNPYTIKEMEEEGWTRITDVGENVQSRGVRYFFNKKAPAAQQKRVILEEAISSCDEVECVQRIIAILFESCKIEHLALLANFGGRAAMDGKQKGGKKTLLQGVNQDPHVDFVNCLRQILERTVERRRSKKPYSFVLSIGKSKILNYAALNSALKGYVEDKNITFQSISEYIYLLLSN